MGKKVSFGFFVMKCNYVIYVKMCTAGSNFFSFAKRIQEEFWRQGDLMKEFDPSATIAPMNDRVYASSTPSHESSLQIGFTLGLVKPLFDLVSVGVLVKHDMYVMYVMYVTVMYVMFFNVYRKRRV